MSSKFKSCNHDRVGDVVKEARRIYDRFAQKVVESCWHVCAYHNTYLLWGNQENGPYSVVKARIDEEWLADLISELPKMLELLRLMSAEISELRSKVRHRHENSDGVQGDDKWVYLCPDCYSYSAGFWENPAYHELAKEGSLESYRYKWACRNCGDFGYLKDKLELYSD